MSRSYRTLGQYGLLPDIPLVPLIPTKGAVGWGKHCHLFSYKAVKERLMGKKHLCAHALFLGDKHHGKALGWSWELKRKVFCHHHRSPACHPASPRWQAGALCHMPLTWQTPHAEALLPVGGASLTRHMPSPSAMPCTCFTGQSWGPRASLRPIQPKSSSLAATALTTLEGPRARPQRKSRMCTIG